MPAKAARDASSPEVEFSAGCGTFLSVVLSAVSAHRRSPSLTVAPLFSVAFQSPTTLYTCGVTAVAVYPAYYNPLCCSGTLLFQPSLLTPSVVDEPYGWRKKGDQNQQRPVRGEFYCAESVKNSIAKKK